MADESTPEASLKAGEIRLDGKIRSVDSKQNIFILDVTSFTLPTGKTSSLSPAKPKTILLTAQAVLHVRGDTKRKLTLSDLKPDAFAIVIGKDLGSGKDLAAREIAVWDKVEAGQYSFGPRPIVAPGAPPGAEHPELVLQLGHRGNIEAAVFSPDGATLASSGDDGTVRLWAAQTGEEQRTFTVDSGRLDSVAFSPDGSIVAATGIAGIVYLWDRKTGALQRKLGANGSLNQVIIAPDGKTVAAVGTVLHLWDMATGELRKTLKGIENAPITAIAFSPDSATLAGASGDKIVLWSTAGAEQEVPAVLDHKQSVKAIAFAPDGKTLASGSGAPGTASEIKLWDVATKSLKQTLSDETDWLSALTFAPDGKTLASGYFGGSVKLWEVATRKVQRTLPAVSYFKTLSFAPDGKTLAGSAFSQVMLWDVAGGALLRTWRGNSNQVRSVVASLDGKMIMSAGSDARPHPPAAMLVKFWNAQAGALLWAFPAALPNHSVEKAILSPDGAILAVTDGWDILLWDTHKFKLLRTLPGRKESITSIAFSPDGSALAAIYHINDRTVRLWDVETGQMRQELTQPKTDTEPSYWFTALAFSPDGKTLAVGASPYLPDLNPGQAQAYSVRLWEKTDDAAAPWKRKSVLPLDTWAVALTFSRDGSTLAVGTVNGTIRLWNTKTGQARKPLAPLRSFVPTEIAFSPDGKLLAVGGYSIRAQIWNLETSELQYTLSGAGEQTTAVAFSPDGSTLLSGDADGGVNAWRSRDGKLLATLMFLPSLNPDATADAYEWITYTPEGYYDGSPGVEAFIRWRVGDRVLPAAKYAAIYRRPDLVQKALRGE